MKPVPTYQEYAEDFGGKLSEETFNANLRLACAEVDDLCMGREVPEGAETAYKAAICCVLGVYAEGGYGPSAGFSIGSFSMSAGGQDVRSFARSEARKVLFPTGLLYAGLD